MSDPAPTRTEVARIAEQSLDALTEGVQIWRVSGRQHYANAGARRLFDLPAEAGELTRDGLLARCLDENGLPVADDACPIHLALQGRSGSGLIVQRKSGRQTRWLRIHAYPLEDIDGQGGPGAISLTVDVTRLKEEGIGLQRQAYYDPLTRLPNRLLLADRMQQALAHCQRGGGSLAVCLLDLDGFKPVNDTLGHKAGDLLLQEISRRLLDLLRSNDTAARIGGDEFALLIGDIKSPHQCEQTLQRILKSIEMPCLVNGQPVRVSASIGVTLYPSDNGDPDLLLRHADQAMYRAKEEGKGRVSLFDPTIASQLKAKQGLLRKIETALDAGQFVLHYQPQVDCRQGRVIGMEALLRWDHPVLGARLPGEFLPLLEQDDLIVRVGEWTIREALTQIARWRERGLNLPVSVNVAARQFLKGDFAKRLGAMLTEFPADIHRRLTIEIVETAALEDVEAVGRVIRDYRDKGLRFSLDDFGTGYSSLLHLKRLPADQLKVDQTFIRDMLDDPDDLAIVQGVIGLANAFQHQVVAEGVESIEQALMLLDLGCDVMQGYGIARPMPAERVPAWMENFAADPRWRVAEGRYPARTDFELLLMEVSHRHWLQRVQSALRHHQPPPSLAYADCRLTRWARRQERLPEQTSIDELHRRVHHFAEMLHACVTAGGDEAEMETAKRDLIRANDALVTRLHAFRLALADGGERPATPSRSR